MAEKDRLKLSGRLFQGFSQRILAIALGGFLLSTLVITFSVQQFFKEESRETILQQQEEISEMVVRHLNHNIRERRENLEAFALLLADGDGLHSKEVIQVMLDQRVGLHRFFNGGMVVLDAGGRSIVDSPRVDGRVGIDFSDRDHVQKARRTAESVITRPLIGRGLQAPVFVIDTPIKTDSGEVLGFIFGVTRLDDPNLFQDIAELVLGKQSELMVIDPGLKLFVTATDPTLAMQKLPAPGLNPVIDHVLEGRNSGYVAGANGQTMLYASARFETMGWHVIHTLPRSLMTRGEKDVLRNMALLTVVVAFITGFLVWHLLRRQLGFLTRTSNRILAMAEGRQPFQTLKGERQDEVGQLIVAFNLLQQQLAQHILRLEQSNQEMSRQSAELARSNAELEQFAYAVSHDLRQPLRMINSYMQLLERALDDKLDDETREMMGHAVGGAQRMDQMLVSLLEYSRVGRKGEPMGPMASREAVAEALDFLAPEIEETGARVQVSGEWPEIVASRDEFTRLWQNLIGNALKYRDPERVPEVEVTVAPEDGGWRFCVADNGIGIDPDQFDRLFQVFQRLHPKGQYEGTGIGLAVARKIVERHGGRIWVESEGAGRGSRFVFTLPGGKTA
ncbi:MAG: ATP-binding protein [Desulfurivibrio sp.]|nr:ATP-binding protein [Desulfurivibrio sp.]